MDIREKTENSKRHPWELARYDIIKKTISKFQNKINFNLLDLGCGDQFVLNNLAIDFPNAKHIGIDIALSDTDIISIGEPFSNVKIYNHYHDEIKGCEFDIILLLDVIEHIEDVNSFFKNITGELKVSNAYFIITVPAFNSLFSEHDHFLGHYRRYSQKSLQRELRNVGLKEIKTHYYFFSLFIARFFEKQLNKIKKRESKGVGQWQGSTFLTVILKSILGIDYRFGNACRKIGLKLPGLSLISINTIQKGND
jgi:hypothetical protein